MAPNRTNSEQYLSDAVGFLVATHTGATRNSQEIKALAALSISQLMISTIQQRAFVWHPTADRIEVRIPTQSVHVYRLEVVPGSDLIPSTLPT
jgi:hypothetical protein